MSEEQTQRKVYLESLLTALQISERRLQDAIDRPDTSPVVRTQAIADLGKLLRQMREIVNEIANLESET